MNILTMADRRRTERYEDRQYEWKQVFIAHIVYTFKEYVTVRQITNPGAHTTGTGAGGIIRTLSIRII